MRTEKEMYDLILNVAKADARVRAVYMNGSRTNPNVAKDIYRDFDIVFAVCETASFLSDKSWIRVFGETAIVQEPDSNDMAWGSGHDFTRSYTWLMLFTDGNRIDLCITVLDDAVKGCSSDTLCVKLLDKDGILPDIPPSNDGAYIIKRPSVSEYSGCCNEFWWCLNNVAKGIARDQMPYAQRMYMQVVHTELDKMTEWFIGAQNGFSVSAGMWGKYFKKYLSPGLYGEYMKTYSCGDPDALWRSIFTACGLFGTIARQVAGELHYTYNESDEKGSTDYLRKVHNGAL